MDFLISSAYAQAAPAAQNPLAGFMPLILIFLVFYFLMIRPQKKRLDEEQQFLKSLAKGQEVYTKAGIIGKIHGLTDSIVTLEVGDGTKMKVLRSHVSGLTSKLFEKKEPNLKDAKLAKAKK